MPQNEKVIDQMARCSFDVRARMDTAVAAILSLCWDYRCVGFSFADFPELDAKVNEILVQMSDGNLSDAEIRAKKAMAEEELQDYEDEAIDFVEGEERNGESVLFRLDRRADHLKELLAGWLAVAAFASLTKTRVMRDFWTYLGNVIASKDWRDSGTPIPKWGRGFQANILRGITVIEQDTINRAFQYARVQQFRERGAIGYRTIRNSSFHCPYCDEMTHYIWPLDEVVLPYHPNCVCVAVPVFENEDER